MEELGVAKNYRSDASSVGEAFDFHDSVPAVSLSPSVADAVAELKHMRGDHEEMTTLADPLNPSLPTSDMQKVFHRPDCSGLDRDMKDLRRARRGHEEKLAEGSHTETVPRAVPPPVVQRSSTAGLSSSPSSSITSTRSSEAPKAVQSSSKSSSASSRPSGVVSILS